MGEGQGEGRSRGRGTAQEAAGKEGGKGSQAVKSVSGGGACYSAAMRTRLILLLMVCIAQSLHAQKATHYMDADELARKCRQAIRVMDGARTNGDLEVVAAAEQCGGYIDGVLDAYAFAKAKGWMPLSVAICAPSVTGDQAFRVLVKYADDHPELLHYGGAEFAHHAFAKAFPCAAQK
jgi:hypothetical protein